MKEVMKYIQKEYIRNAFIPQNWKDIRIADIPKLSEIFEGTLNVWPSFIQEFERMDFNNQILINITKSIKDALGPK